MGWCNNRDDRPDQVPAVCDNIEWEPFHTIYSGALPIFLSNCTSVSLTAETIFRIFYPENANGLKNTDGICLDIFCRQGWNLPIFILLKYFPSTSQLSLYTQIEYVTSTYALWLFYVRKMIKYLHFSIRDSVA